MSRHQNICVYMYWNLWDAFFTLILESKGNKASNAAP